MLNQPYSDTITVEIQNELFDDSFRYRFTVSGDLPTGISASAMGRRYVLEGTPTVQGPFSFTVLVNVDNELTIRPGPNGAVTEDNGLCFLEASRTFDVVVQP